MRAIAERVIRESIEDVLPESSVARVLSGRRFGGRVFLVAIGKGAWRMADAAVRELGQPVCDGIVITKYGHVEGEIAGVQCLEAGHPIPDESSYKATETVLEMVGELNSEDTVLFLVSGGGSALFELPAVSPDVVERVNRQLIESGASIAEINAVRKRLSKVKGGRFAQACAPARVLQIVLSDVVGDRLDVIASGPAAVDLTTTREALGVLDRYGVELEDSCLQTVLKETPKSLSNVETIVCGGVSALCDAAAKACERAGFTPVVVTREMVGEASVEGREMASEALRRLSASPDGPMALIAGGETVVTVRGNGLGGRNQEFALAAASVLDGTRGVSVVSVGSDGTDGPTDAAGGYADGRTWQAIRRAGIDPEAALSNNDSYHALKACQGLVVTGPTGTNVNDVAIAFIDPRAV